MPQRRASFYTDWLRCPSCGEPLPPLVYVSVLLALLLALRDVFFLFF